MGEILKFRSFKSSSDNSPTGYSYLEESTSTTQILGSITDAKEQLLSEIRTRLPVENLPGIEDLYPQSDYRSPHLDTAIKLLKEIISRLTEALNHIREDNAYEADDCINRIILLLPELFCCRSLGEGFESIIVAFNYAIKNKDGELLSEREIITLRKLINRLFNEPFISFDEAINESELLEEEGFILEPAELSDLMVVEDE